jgi:exopolysaccharide biosynthesis polyprenyl glycosylphosphotransferase
MNTRRKLLLNAFKLFDLGLMLLAFMTAALVVFHQTRTITALELFSIRVKIHNVAIFALFILVWHVIFSLLGLYESRRLSNSLGEIVAVMKATSLGTLLILVSTVIFRIVLVTRLFLIVFWVVSTCAIVASRLVLRVTLALIRKRGRNLRHVLIVGSGNRAVEFARWLVARPELGYRISGFADQNWNGTDAFQRRGYGLACDLDGLAQFLRTNVVDEVVLALPFRSMHDQASRIATICEEQGITVRVLTHIFNLKLAHSSVQELEDDALFTHCRGWAEGWPIFIKRILDFTISSILMTLLLPVLAVTAILVKLTSPGPVLFAQKRLGLNKRHFNVYKFRTMVADAEKRLHEVEHLNQVSGPVFKVWNDPRITPVGRFLRKTSIDELPQLFNVLRGDMSLVGPRPLPVRDYEGFNKDWQRRRLSVKPGITCLWQIRGRSSIPFEEWMELDLQYIDRWSLWLDLQILLRTIPAVLKGSGAA